MNQKLAVKILEKYGHTVEIAENGSLAVDAFRARVQRNRPFDIILVRVRTYLSLIKLISCRIGQMDVSMPVMGGMEATELIRAYETHNNLTPTPIIAVAAHWSAYSFYDEVALRFVTFCATFFSGW